MRISQDQHFNGREMMSQNRREIRFTEDQIRHAAAGQMEFQDRSEIKHSH